MTDRERKALSRWPAFWLLFVAGLAGCAAATNAPPKEETPEAPAAKDTDDMDDHQTIVLWQDGKRLAEFLWAVKDGSCALRAEYPDGHIEYCPMDGPTPSEHCRLGRTLAKVSLTNRDLLGQLPQESCK